jgi:D-glycero-alpha-D-manno-heptose-7-phosphate kinase
MYAAGKKAGALGGKLLGAGGGGFLLLYVPPERQAAVREALKKLLHVPCRFEFLGSQIIYFAHEDPL